MTFDLENETARQIERHRLITPADRVLVACSGGPDSTALAAVLRDLAQPFQFRLEILHINHLQRGQSATDDEAFCRDLADRLGLPFHRADLGSRPAGPANLEEAMRLRRREIYGFFLEQGFQRIALGHTRDDQAETVLLRLFRGAGLEGLSAMSPCSPPGLIRPLLEIGRREILAYLQQRGISYREDASNRDLRFLRNRIRLQVLPLLEREINPGVIAVLARTAAVLRSEFEALQGEARPWLANCLARDATGVSFRRDDFLACPDHLRMAVIRGVLRTARGDLRKLSTAHCREALDFVLQAGPGRQFVLPGPTRMIYSYGVVRLEYQPAAGPVFEYRLEIPGSVTIPETGEAFRAGTMGEFPDPGTTVRLPAGVRHLLLRPLRPGDRLRAPYGRKKLKKLFQERKIPSFQRTGITLVTSPDGEIVWIPDLDCSMCYNEAGSAGETIILERHRA